MSIVADKYRSFLHIVTYMYLPIISIILMSKTLMVLSGDASKTHFCRTASKTNPNLRAPLFTYETEFVLFLAMLENSVLPMG